MPHAGQTTKPLVKLGKSPDDCWQWLSHISSSGHGKKTYCGRVVMAHRWMWEQLFGPIPYGMVVFNTCGNKQCVNPHHLRLGYQADANRHSIQTILVPSDVRDVRAVPKDERCAATARQLAERLQVSASLIKDIWIGRAWGSKKPNHGPKRRAA